MAETRSADALLDFWKKQVEEGTKAWVEAIGRGTPPDPSSIWRPFVDQSIAAWAAVMGQSPVSPELMTQWRQFLDQWITAWGEALERAMQTEAFTRALGQYLDQWISAQAPVRKAAGEISTTVLEALGLPTRTDLERFSHQVADLDDRLERLEDQLTAKGPRPAAARSRSRPRPRAAVRSRRRGRR